MGCSRNCPYFLAASGFLSWACMAIPWSSMRTITSVLSSTWAMQGAWKANSSTRIAALGYTLVYSRVHPGRVGHLD